MFMSNLVAISFLDTLFIAIDANFRLKRKNVSSHESNPGLSKGFSYFVEETTYRDHLKNYMSEAEPVSGMASVLSLVGLMSCSRKARVRVMTL